MSKAKISTAIGSILLLITAGFHSTGFPQASREANAETAGPLTSMTFEGIWLMPAISWAVLAVISLYSAFGQAGHNRAILALIAAIPLAHAAVILIYTGPFIGAYMLIAASALLMLGALRVAKA